MLQAYVDDSNMGQGTVSVLGGWVARAEQWAKFSDDWQSILDMKPAVPYFKWSHARGLGGEFKGISEPMRDEKIRLLAATIAEHKLLGVASAMPNALYQEAFRLNIDPVIRYPYFISFYGLVVQLAEYLASQGIKEKIDFIFDIQPGQMQPVLAAWERLTEQAPENVRAILGDPPSFKSDIGLPPLQAADMSAGWLRECAEDKMNGAPDQPPPWGDKANQVRCLGRFWNQEMLTEFLARSRIKRGHAASAVQAS
jgi:hypothetical protein